MSLNQKKSEQEMPKITTALAIYKIGEILLPQNFHFFSSSLMAALPPPRVDMERRRRHTCVGNITFDPPQSHAAYVFLCLFDGFRIPSIRRLTRRPQTICFNPLINYDPSLFAPATTNAINARYQELLHCSCQSLIDPTTREVTAQIAKTAGRSPNDRVIIHYFGQGSLPPKLNGSLYFFDANRSSYRGLSMSTVIGANTAPVCLIVDVSSAGNLIPAIQQIINEEDRDIIAFMACASDEKLPSAPSLPLDILSCSILFGIDSALWLHLNRDVFSDNFESFSDFDPTYLSKFLDAVLESIAVSKFPVFLYQKLMCEDQALATITRGFILASRILSFHGVHTCSIPELPRTDDSDIWGYWDLALDSVLARGVEVLPHLRDVFQQLATSFQNFPSPSLIPIFCHFLEFTCYYEKIGSLLYDYVDGNAEKISHELNLMLIRKFLGLPRRSILYYLIISKLTMEFFPDQNILQELSKVVLHLEARERMAGFMTMCCCLCTAVIPNQSQFLKLCVDFADAAAPYSAIMFGLIVQRSTAFMANDAYCAAFLPLLSSPREEIRASGVFALGFTRDLKAIPPLISALSDSSELVVSEAIIGLSMALRFDTEKNSLEEAIVDSLEDHLKRIPENASEIVRKTYEATKGGFDQFFMKIRGGTGSPTKFDSFRSVPTSRLPALLRQSVRARGLKERYYANIFSLK